MRTTRVRIGVVIGALIAAVSAKAGIRLASLFTDNAVLQRNSNVPIWGWANPGASITATASWGAQAKGKADKDGKFVLKIKTPAAGGPYNVMLSGDGKIGLSNLLIGDVWICSGQSNMEMTLQKGYPPPIPNQAAEIASATYPQIRLFHVAKAMVEKPADTCGGKWEICSPETVGGFSACGYFFGREIYNAVKIPVGLVDTTWGGTEVELWTSERAMMRIPDFATKINGAEAARKQFEQQSEEWLKSFAAADAGTNNWSNVICDERGFNPCPAAPTYDQMGLSDFDGVVWVRASFELGKEEYRHDWTLELGAIDDEDATFVNGKQVGLTSGWQTTRKYKLPKELLLEGTNVVAIRLLDIMGPGGFTDPTKVFVASGDERLPLKNWRFHRSVAMSSLPPRPQYQGARFSLLYNGMIAPLIPYTIKGAIWYQGEANVGRAFQYRTSFPNMIRNWREDWQSGQFPFYFVQIAPFNYGNNMSQELREAQFLTLSLPNTGMAVTTDITDDVRDIHPINKQDVGKRLALWALAKDYGRATVEYSGPLYDGYHIEGSQIYVKFRHAAGLTLRNGQSTGIEIAGVDRKFVAAEARVVNGELIVSSPSIEKPVAVRYCWSDAGIGFLQNAAGLPASPFRTDAWPGLTDKNKW
ncbi:MAG: sialate O-acetylesterase [Fimbriimonadales bacterium]